MKAKVAINGFGRIGRVVFRNSLRYSDFEVVAINDITNIDVLAHLLKYDSIHGTLEEDVTVEGDSLVVGDHKIRVCSERDPKQLPWKELGIDIVVESTGIFRDKERVMGHIEAGAKKAIISAPAKNEDITIVMGVNEDQYDPAKHVVLSNASCTTNCLAPFTKVIHETYGIRRGIMTTIHSYTNDQQLLDLPHSDLRRARAAAESMIPTSTGAASAVAKVLPELKGKLTGMAVRVPTPNVSLTDVVFELDKDVTVEEINGVLKAAAEGPLKGILAYSDKPLVSRDYNGSHASSTIDSLSTLAIEGNLVKILAWYDNETGYSTRVCDLVDYMVKKGI